jgi:hypothetical protein
LLFLDDVDASVKQSAPARGRYLLRLDAREHDAPPPPEVRVEQHGQAGPPQGPDQPVDTGGVIEMTVGLAPIPSTWPRTLSAACPPWVDGSARPPPT